MDDGARRWLAKTAKKHFWRISRWYELEDLIQEGYAAYAEVMRRYPTASAPQHRMALFKRVYMSRVHDMASKRTRSVAEVCFTDMAVEREKMGLEGSLISLLDRTAAEPEMSAIAPALARAPQYVKDALALFTTEAGLARLRSAYRKVPSGRWLRRETLNERLCRLIGSDPLAVDVVEALRALLGVERPAYGVVVKLWPVQPEYVVERVTRAGRYVKTQRRRGAPCIIASCSRS